MDYSPEELVHKISQIICEDHQGDSTTIQILCDEQKIDKNLVDTMAYKFARLIIKDFIFSGKSKGKKPEGIDPKEFEMGQKIEFEHSPNKYIAKKIAWDHLTECKDYYTRLQKLEKECAKDQGSEEIEEDVIIGTAGGEL